ncbi:MAG: type II secretion system GspH family protein [Magnetococcus sp. YQC-5]
MKSLMHRNASGFTYIEILIAILVMGIIAPSLGGTMLSLSRSAGLGRELVHASFLLQSTADDIIITRRLYGYDHADLAVGTRNIGDVTIDGITFSRSSVTVLIAPGTSDCPASAAVGDCKEVTISVTSPSGLVTRTIEPFKNYALICT